MTLLMVEKVEFDAYAWQCKDCTWDNTSTHSIRSKFCTKCQERLLKVIKDAKAETERKEHYRVRSLACTCCPVHGSGGMRY